MDHVQLSSTYYLDVALMRAGEPAEILWVRAKAWSMDQETDGVIPREILPRLVATRGKARVDALLREGLWVLVPAGWQFARWDQITSTRMEAKREAGRERAQRHRDRNAVTNDARTRFVTEPREGRKEGKAAAAAAGDRFDPAIDDLRTSLQAHPRLQALRFDTLPPSAAADLADLIAVHGVDRLTQVALDTCRATPPVHASAFLGTWAALPPPGPRLRAVPRPRCEIHDTQRTAAGICTGCAADTLETGA